ncbi:MAG: RNA polymerase sigma factor [Planctomycetota bacterium]
MPALPDPDLIALCLEGREEAWEALVDRYADLVHGIGRRSGLDGAAAEDLVQDVFVLLWRHLPRLRARERLAGWIAQTARREAWRRRRRGRSRVARDEAVGRDALRDDGETEDPVEAAEQRHLLRRALDTLGERCRALLDALFLRGIERYEDVSAELDMPVGSIGPTRRRCLAQMVDALADLGFPLDDVSAGLGAASGEVKATRRSPRR